MNFPFLNNPDTGKPDETVTIAIFVSLAVVFRFLVDGMTLNLFGHLITFSKLDATVYISLLGPALASHSYVKVKSDK